MTIPKPFNLGLDKRLHERQLFKDEQDQRQKTAEERERASQEEREKEELKALKEYRKSLDFKVIINVVGVYYLELSIPLNLWLLTSQTYSSTSVCLFVNPYSITTCTKTMLASTPGLHPSRLWSCKRQKLECRPGDKARAVPL